MGGFVRGPGFVAPDMSLDAYDPEPATAEAQVWVRPIADSNDWSQRMHMVVDAEGRVRLHESVVAQLLADAGWERTA